MADVKLTPTALDKLLRKKNVDLINALLTANGEDVIQVSGNILAFPTLNADGEDSWIEITVTVPKGEKLDVGYAGYDGYEQAETYKKAQEEIAEKERKRQEKAASDIAKRTAKKTKSTEVESPVKREKPTVE